MSRMTPGLWFAAASLTTLSLFALAGCGTKTVASKTPAATPPSPAAQPDSAAKSSSPPQVALKPVVAPPQVQEESPAPARQEQKRPETASPPDQGIAQDSGRDQALPAADAKPTDVPPPAPTLTPPPAAPPKLPTWAEVEAKFDKLRAQPDYEILHALYSQVATPDFTQSDDYEKHIQQLQAWRTEYPQSPTPLIALGRAYIDYAWQARGNGLAHMVTEEGWQLFGERIEKAHKLLEEAVSLGVKDARVYADLITVAMAKGLPVEQARAWVDEGLKLDPDYYATYMQMAIYLLPRWCGERGDIEKFAGEIATALPGDDGLEAYARIAFQIHLYGAEETLVFQGDYDRDLLVRGSQVFAKRRPQSDRVAHFAALCAWAAQDHEAARQIQPRLGPFKEEDRIWPWVVLHREFVEWSQAEAPSDKPAYRWIWGPLFGSQELVFASDSKHLWTGANHSYSSVMLLDVEQGKPLVKLPGPPSLIEHLQLDHARGWLAVALRGKDFQGIVIFNLKRPAQPAGFPTKENCRALALHPTEDQIVWSEGKIVHIADLHTGEKIRTIDLPSMVRQICFSVDGKRLAIQSDSQEIWDPATGEKMVRLPHYSMKPRPESYCQDVLRIDVDGKVLAVARILKNGNLPLLRYEADGSAFATVISNLRHSGDSGHFILSPDGLHLATISYLGDRAKTHACINLWNTETGKWINRYDANDKHIRYLAFSPDGKTLASAGSPTGLIKFWSVEAAAVAPKAP